MLPIFQTPDRILSMLQTKWSSELNPVLASPLLAGNLLQEVSLISGATVINHKLGRRLTGWFIVDINAAASIYRSAAKNDKTLTLTSNAVAIADIWVF